LWKKLKALDVESEVISEQADIQSYIGQLKVRQPQLIVRYSEDFVLDLHQYKRQLLHAVSRRGARHVAATVSGFEKDSRGNITAVLRLTSCGKRFETDLVFYAGRMERPGLPPTLSGHQPQ
jgi:hypothetical protein